jgi:hypothetical protein
LRKDWRNIKRVWNTRCNRIKYKILKTYCDQTNSNITTQFLTEHFLTLQVFYKCSVLLPLVMRQTSRRYSNSTHCLSKKLASTRAVVLTVLSQISWRSTGMGDMYTLSFTNPQNEKSMGVRFGDLGGYGIQPPRPSLVEVYQLFGGACCLHHEGDRPDYMAQHPRRQPSSQNIFLAKVISLKLRINYCIWINKYTWGCAIK